MIIATRAERFECARTEYNVHGSQSIAEVAKATGIQASMISDLENNDKSRGVSYEAVAALAKHYGVFADYLLGLSAVPSRKADEQAIGIFTGFSPASVERLAYGSSTFPRERDCLDRLLSTSNFPALLEALDKVERALQSANRALELQHQNKDAALGENLLEERLGLAVFRVVKVMTDICYEIYPLEETEKRFSSLRKPGQKKND